MTTCRAVFDGKECGEIESALTHTEHGGHRNIHINCRNDGPWCHPFDNGTSCAEAPEAIAEAQEQAIQERVGAELERLAPLCTFPGCGKPEEHEGGYHECGDKDCPFCEGKYFLNCHPFQDPVVDAPPTSAAPGDEHITTVDRVTLQRIRKLVENPPVPNEALIALFAEYDAAIASGKLISDATLPRDEQDLVTDAMLEAARGAWFSAHDTFRDRMTAAIEAALSASLAKPAHEGGTNEPLLTDAAIESEDEGLGYRVRDESFERGAKWARDFYEQHIQERREA